MSHSSSGERIWNPGPNRVIAGILGIGSGMSKRDEGSSADGPTPEAVPPKPTSSETPAFGSQAPPAPAGGPAIPAPPPAPAPAPIPGPALIPFRLVARRAAASD